jgi:hypothetical protein
MTPLAFVITVCSALAGSPHRDHCTEIRVPVVVDALPTSCVAKAQEYIASNPERFEEADIISFGCVRRTQVANAGEQE